MGLYSFVPPPGTNFPISVQPFPVDDLLPTEDEIEWAVTRLQNHCSRGPLGMRAEHLKRWLAMEQKAEKSEKYATTRARAGKKENRDTAAVQ